MSLSLNPTNWFKKKEEAEIKPEEEHSLTPVEAREVGKQSHKLTEGQKEVIIDYIAQGLTPTQIVNECADKHGIKIFPIAVYQFKQADKWQEKLKVLRKYYQNRMDDIDVTSKAVRMRRLDKIQDKAIKQGRLNVAVSANNEMRRELEGDGDSTNVYINNPTYNQLNVLSTEELLKKQKEATRKLFEKQSQQKEKE